MNAKANTSSRNFHAASIAKTILWTAALFGGLLLPAAAQPAGIPAKILIRDTVVHNTDANLNKDDDEGDTELSIAVNPANQFEVVVSGFAERWNQGDAPLWHSQDGGITWTKDFVISPPDMWPGLLGPADQAIDFRRDGSLVGAFLGVLPAVDNLGAPVLTVGGRPVGNNYVFTASWNNLLDLTTWTWKTDGAGKAVTTQPGATVTPGVRTPVQPLPPAPPTTFTRVLTDQPWLLVNRDPTVAAQDNVFVAYDDFLGAPGPDMRVSVSLGVTPPNFLVAGDKLTGNGNRFGINPGHRLATDPRNGTVYDLWQSTLGAGVGPGAGGSKNIDFKLNRSTDGGTTWTLNGNATGIIVANANSTQPNKFGDVNALLGGALHAAVNPANGDVYYVYGRRFNLVLPWFGSMPFERLAIRRLTANVAGGLDIGAESFVTGFVDAAIPSVAVTTEGTVGVLYYTLEGTEVKAGKTYPIFTAHLAFSRNQGGTFTDIPLCKFRSAAEDNGAPDQRVLGDYMQLKAVGRTFYGAFTANGATLGRPKVMGEPIQNHDPVFFRVSMGGSKLLVEAPRDFGQVCAGLVFEKQLRIYNAGATDLTINNIVRNAGSANISVVPGPVFPVTIAPGTSKDFRVRCLAPEGAVADNATIRITSNDPDLPAADIIYNYTLGAPRLEATIAGGNAFGNVNVGAGVNRILTLKNTGPCDLRVRKIESDKADFQVLPVFLPRVLKKDKSFNVTIRYAPTGLGLKNAKISITHNGDNAVLGKTELDVSGNTPAPAAPVAPVMPPVLATLGQVEYAWAPLGFVNAGLPVWGNGNFIANRQVLIGPGGGMRNLGPGVTIFRAAGPIFPFPGRASWLGRPPFGFAQTTFGANVLGGINWGRPTFMQDRAIDGIANINLSRGVGIFRNILPFARVAMSGGMGIRGFIPFGAQGSIGVRISVNGNPNRIPPAVIAVNATGPVPFGFVRGTAGQNPIFTPVPGGYLFTAWVTTAGFIPPIQPNAIFMNECTYTIISDPGLEVDYDNSLIPSDQLPDSGALPDGGTLPPPVGSTTLAITKLAGPNVRLSWPTATNGASALGLGLQQSSSLSTSVWSQVTQQVVLAGSEYRATVPLTGTERYFRLSGLPSSIELQQIEFLHGDYTVAGAGVRGTGSGGTATASFTISDVPPGARIAAAYLYWATRGNGTSASFTLGPTNVALLGTPLGTNLSPCSTLTNITVYRADILPFLPVSGTNQVANGTYFVSVPDSGDINTAPSTEGVSAVIIYEDASLPLKAVSLYDGAVSMNVAGNVFNLVMQNFGVAAYSNVQARLTHVVANGSAPAGDLLFFNNLRVDPTTNSAFNGAQGTRWDNPTFDVSARVNPGDAVATTTVRLPALTPDCLTWGAAVFSVTIPDSPGFWTGTPTNSITNSLGTSFLIASFAGDGGTINPADVTNVTPGSAVSFIATPDAQRQVDQWLVDGDLAQAGGNAFNLTGIQADHIVAVTFRASDNTADLSLRAAAAPDPVLVGSNFTYSITITNLGPGTATNASVTNVFTPSVNILSAVSSQGSCSILPNSVVCSLGDLPAAGSATLTIIVTPLADGDITDQITVASPTVDTNPADNSDTLVVAALSPPYIITPPVSQTVNEGATVLFNVMAGGTAPLRYQWVFDDVVELTGETNATLTLTNVVPEQGGTYTVFVSNDAGSTYADPATLTVAAQYRITATNGPGGTISPAGVTTAFEGDSPAFSATPGGAVTGWFVDGEVAQIGGASFVLTNVGADHLVAVGFGSEVDLELVITNDYPVHVEVGTNITFTCVVSNDGTNTASNVQVTVALPEEISLLAGSASQGSYTAGAGMVNWSVGSLAGGQSATLSLLTTFLEVPPEIMVVTGAVSATETDLRTANNEATDALAFGETGAVEED
ncbi:MAG: choice-of-anchor D domain-containing protein [Pedosphaera sp.]|nr:choice-of-anchor D domain-containing protein [Pedosphaera sp.]